MNSIGNAHDCTRHDTVLMMSTGPSDQDKSISQFLFRNTVYKIKFKNLIWTSKLKFSFQGLSMLSEHDNNIQNVLSNSVIEGPFF